MAVCCKNGLSRVALYKLRAKFAGMEVFDARRLRRIEDENGKLNRLPAESVLIDVNS